MAKRKGKLAIVEEAAEAAEALIASGSLKTFDEIKDALENVAEVAREQAEEFRDASANWRGGAGNEDWDEKAALLDSYADELEAFMPTSEPEFDDDEEGKAKYLAEIREEASDVLNDRSW